MTNQTRTMNPGEIGTDEGTIDINTAEEGAPVPATSKPKCICCEEPVDLLVAKGDVPFAVCPDSKMVYERMEDGHFELREGYSVDATHDRILDADNNQVYPVPAAPTAPSTNDLLSSCAADDESVTGESAGGAKPDATQRERVDIRQSDFH